MQVLNLQKILRKQMLKEDWIAKEMEFSEMLEKAKTNKGHVENQIEELEIFLETIRDKIKTFK